MPILSNRSSSGVALFSSLTVSQNIAILFFSVIETLFKCSEYKTDFTGRDQTSGLAEATNGVIRTNDNMINPRLRGVAGLKRLC